MNAEVLRWTISISTLVTGIATAIAQLPQITWQAAIPAVLIYVSGWVQRNTKLDYPQAKSVLVEKLDLVTQEVVARMRERGTKL